MDQPIVFGAAYSVYVRIVRLALEEKHVGYQLREIDVFAPDGPSPDYLARHPFGRIPAFEHAGFRLYEAGAITRYVDDAFPGPTLQPTEAKPRARMNQVLSILDSYAYRALVWDIFVERVRAPEKGRQPDEDRIRSALPVAGQCLAALEEIMGDGPFLSGTDLTLADLHAAPMLAYFVRAPEGGALLTKHASLHRWWDRISQRESMTATRFPVEDQVATGTKAR
jgi:glutathione S-transferase